MPRDYNLLLADLQDRFDVIDDRLSADEIELTVVKASPYGICPWCGHASDSIHQTTPRRVTDCPIGRRKVTLLIYKRRFRCPHCGKVFTEAFGDIAPRGRWTRRYEGMVYEHAKTTCLIETSRAFGIAYTTFRRLWFRKAGQELEKREAVYPRIMGIDEFSVAKRHRYHTVMTDIERHRVFDAVPGRDSEGVRSRLVEIPQGKRPGVFVIDLWRPYVKAIRGVCPDAEIVADRFHVTRLVNLALDRVRKGEQKGLRSGERNLVFGVRYLLLTGGEKLDVGKRERLKEALGLSMRLAEGYRLKEGLREIYNRYQSVQDYPQACAALRAWCDAALVSNLAPFEKTAKTLLRWFVEVTNYLKYRVTNGYTEGINNKIKLDKRRAYGYRNFDNQRMRILTGCA